MTVEYPETADLVVLGTGLVQSVVAWCVLPPDCTAASLGASRFLHCVNNNSVTTLYAVVQCCSKAGKDCLDS